MIESNSSNNSSSFIEQQANATIPPRTMDNIIVDGGNGSHKSAGLFIDTSPSSLVKQKRNSNIFKGQTEDISTSTGNMQEEHRVVSAPTVMETAHLQTHQHYHVHQPPRSETSINTTNNTTNSGKSSPSTLTHARMMKRCSKQQLLSMLPKKPLLRIQYASHCCSGIISEQLKGEILKVAQRENEQNGITGVLICVSDMFFQIIEGHSEQVDRLYHNILKDKRHYDVVCVDKMYFDLDSERYFPSWCMQSLEIQSLFEHCLDPSQSTAVGAAFRAFTTLLGSLLNTQQVFRNYAQPAISKYLSEGENPMIKESVETNKVILFIDLVNYTSITEKVSKTRKASQIVNILNTFFGVVMETVEEYCGEITKLIGDCVMVYFDGNECQQAVDCSIDILEKLEELRQSSEDPCIKMIYCTIGISRGSVIFGNVGSVGRKLDFTVIGDSVNTASRLQSFASISPHFIIFDESVKEGLDETDEECIIDVGPIDLKGKEKSVKTYTINHELNYKPPKKEMDRIMSLSKLGEYC